MEDNSEILACRLVQLVVFIQAQPMCNVAS